MQKEGTKHFLTRITECRNAEQNRNMQIGEKKFQGGIIFLSFLLMLRTFLLQISGSLEVEDPLKSIFQHNCMSNLAIECVQVFRDIDTFEKGCVLTNSPCWWCKLITSLCCDKTMQLAHLSVQWSQGGHLINSGQ